MNFIKKVKIILIAILMFFSFGKCFALTQEEAGQIIAQFAINFYENFRDETVYTVYNYTDNINSPRAISYRGQRNSSQSMPCASQRTRGGKTIPYSNKYGMDCVGFVSFCIHQSLKIGSDTTFTCFGTPQSGPSNGFYKVTDGSRKPGDIVCSKNQHVGIYIGNGQMIDAAGSSQNTIESRKLTKGAVWSNMSETYRISESTASKIKQEETTVQFEGKGAVEYSFAGSDDGTIISTMILSGTPPTHWQSGCKDFSGYFSWTNVSYVESTETEAADPSEIIGETTFVPGDEDTITTKAGTFPRYRQRCGSPWEDWTFANNTIGNQGCGPTSIATILAGWGLIIPGYDGAQLKGKASAKDGVMTPPEVCAYSLAVGGHVLGAGMSHDFPGMVMRKLGIEYITLDAGQAEKVLEYLNQGYAGVASASTGYFTGGGHIIAVVGANPDDGGKTIGIVDPYVTTRDAFYTVDQLNGVENMPALKGAGGRRNANIVKWWIFKYNKPE